MVVCGDAAASVARTVGPGQPWGRGRIAVIPKAADGQVAYKHSRHLKATYSIPSLTANSIRILSALAVQSGTFC